MGAGVKWRIKNAKVQKKNPALAVCTWYPLNMFYNMWNSPGCFRLPAKACRPQPELCSWIV